MVIAVSSLIVVKVFMRLGSNSNQFARQVCALITNKCNNSVPMVTSPSPVPSPLASLESNPKESWTASPSSGVKDKTLITSPHNTCRSVVSCLSGCVTDKTRENQAVVIQRSPDPCQRDANCSHYRAYQKTVDLITFGTKINNKWVSNLFAVTVNNFMNWLDFLVYFYP